MPRRGRLGSGAKSVARRGLAAHAYRPTALRRTPVTIGRLISHPAPGACMAWRITSLTVERYKLYERACTLELRPLTLLIGSNNAGKSALARALPLVLGALARGVADEQVLPLESFGLTHGRSFEDLITDRAVHGHIDVRWRQAGCLDRRDVSGCCSAQRLVAGAASSKAARLHSPVQGRRAFSRRRRPFCRAAPRRLGREPKRRWRLFAADHE